MSVDASILGELIPHLAGNLVVQDFYADPRLEKFFNEIGPNLIQGKLFLANLNEARDNYQFLKEPGVWESWFQRVHAAGGETMLHLRNVPGRLTKHQSANQMIRLSHRSQALLQESGKRLTGKAPMTKEGNREWQVIVKEVVSHFQKNPNTRIDYIQSIGEPNIGTNWYDENDVLIKSDGGRLFNKRPENAREFAKHFLDTLNAAHEIDDTIKVGGPTLWFSTNDKIWWDGFLGFLSEKNAPLGFVSTHIYDINFGIWDKGVELTQQKVERYGYGDLPIIMTS